MAFFKSFFHSRPKLKKFIKIILITFLFLILLYSIVPLPDPLFERNYSTVVTDERGKILRVFLNINQQWHFPPQKNLNIPLK